MSVITLIYPDGTKLVARGECEGSISEEMRGENGFGYDPDIYFQKDMIRLLVRCLQSSRIELAIGLSRF